MIPGTDNEEAASSDPFTDLDGELALSNLDGLVSQMDCCVTTEQFLNHDNDVSLASKVAFCSC